MNDREQGGGTPQDGERGETPDGVEPPLYGTPPEQGTPPSPGTPSVHGTPSYGTPTYGTPMYGTPSYGTPSYGTPAYPGFGPARSPGEASLRTQAIVALILNILATLMCCLPLGIAGAVTAGLAISRVDTDIARARTLVHWGWGLLIASVLLALTGFVTIFVLLPAFGSGALP